MKRSIFSAILAFCFTLAITACNSEDRALKMPDLLPRSGDSTSAEFVKAQQMVRHLRQEISRHPDELKNYINLAQAYLQEARVSGRHHEYFPIANGIIEEVLRKDADNFEANVLKAGMQMTEHNFTQAKE